MARSGEFRVAFYDNLLHEIIKSNKVSKLCDVPLSMLLTYLRCKNRLNCDCCEIIRAIRAGVYLDICKLEKIMSTQEIEFSPG